MRNDCSNCGTKSEPKHGCFPIDSSGPCTMPTWRKWTPKQNNVEKSCETCDYSRQMEWNDAGCDENRNEPLLSCGIGNTKWKLRRDYNQENKEQEMSYKTTSKCTLRNIMNKILETGCSDAESEFFHVIAECNGDMLYSVHIDSGMGLYKILTKTEKRRNWLLKFGFLEEEISLKPCPFCNSKDVSSVNEDYVECNKCDTCGPAFKSEQEAIKAWNKRV